MYGSSTGQGSTLAPRRASFAASAAVKDVEPLPLPLLLLPPLDVPEPDPLPVPVVEPVVEVVVVADETVLGMPLPEALLSGIFFRLWLGLFGWVVWFVLFLLLGC